MPPRRICSDKPEIKEEQKDSAGRCFRKGIGVGVRIANQRQQQQQQPQRQPARDERQNLPLNTYTYRELMAVARRNNMPYNRNKETLLRELTQEQQERRGLYPL